MSTEELATVGLCESDGTLLMVTTRLDGDGDIPYETLRTLIGGLIDRVLVSDTIDVWVHDEGRYLLPFNVLSMPFYPIGLHGPMVFTTYDEHGGTGPITQAAMKRLIPGAMWCPTHTVEQVVAARQRGDYWHPGEPA